MNNPVLPSMLRPSSGRLAVGRGQALEACGLMAAMLGGILAFGLAATLAGVALVVAGGLAWFSGWWCNYESWCARCRDIVEKNR